MTIYALLVLAVVLLVAYAASRGSDRNAAHLTPIRRRSRLGVSPYGMSYRRGRRRRLMM